MSWVSVMEIVRPVGTCGCQLERIGQSQLEGINRASEIVVIGPVGEIVRTDGTEWTGPMSGTIDKDSDIDMGK